MKARRPSLDFSRAPAGWIPDAPGYAYQLDAASTMLPYLEPYLIKVQKLAREQLDPDRHAELIRDIDVFNHQEANHFRLHAKYNEALRGHYPGLEAFEAEVKADFDSFLRDRSLAWNLAYCEGFECMGLVGAEFFFGPAEPFLRTADRAPRDLWACISRKNSSTAASATTCSTRSIPGLSTAFEVISLSCPIFSASAIASPCT